MVFLDLEILLLLEIMSKRFVDLGDIFLVKGWFYIQKIEDHWTLREEIQQQQIIKFGIYTLNNVCWPEYLRIYGPQAENAPRWWGLPHRTFYHDTVYYDFDERLKPENYCLSDPCFKALVKFLKQHKIEETNEKL